MIKIIIGLWLLFGALSYLRFKLRTQAVFPLMHDIFALVLAMLTGPALLIIKILTLPRK